MRLTSRLYRRAGQLSVVLIATVLLAGPQSGRADDWPQWMGPERDGVWHDDGIVTAFDEDGPPVLWRVRCGTGYSGPAVAEGRVFLADLITDDDLTPAPSILSEVEGIERVVCLDALSGDELWVHEYPCQYKVSFPAGPRVTPTVDGDLVYSLGTMGDLYCLSVRDGTEVWSHSFQDDYDAPVPTWGFTAHPLVHGDLLICLVGGEGSVAVAFDKRTGDEVWRALSAEQTGYAPPKIIEAGGTEQLLIWHGEALNSLNPADGSVYWTIPLAPGYGMSIAAPCRSGDLLFAGGYGDTSAGIRLDADKPAAEVIWNGSRGVGISCINSTPVAVGDYVYGIDRGGELRCLEAETGEHLWSTTQPVTGDRPANSGTAFIVRNGDRFFIFNEQGDLVIAEMSPEGFEEISRAHIIEPRTFTMGRDVVWSHPAFANKCVFARNDEEIVCVLLAE